ncbi:hypothetical protein DFR50_1397 [Roseiarcus fermentans]|uniref:Uncharacterized protein n=1 Tax=Roseiarcus fermentans TaxID=1473586 RepID=A0A366ES71_9HYPH|nr:hypothetical protein DFR50_1397 [Roseiarcus fermentans]
MIAEVAGRRCGVRRLDLVNSAARGDLTRSGAVSILHRPRTVI